jgi:hypothetical protein
MLGARAFYHRSVRRAPVARPTTPSGWQQRVRASTNAHAFIIRPAMTRTPSLAGAAGRGTPSVHTRDCYSISYNVSAVYEVPELTDRSAEGFPRPSQATLFTGCVARPRSGRRVTPSVLCDVFELTVAQRFPLGQTYTWWHRKCSNRHGRRCDSDPPKATRIAD